MAYDDKHFFSIINRLYPDTEGTEIRLRFQLTNRHSGVSKDHLQSDSDIPYNLCEIESQEGKMPAASRMIHTAASSPPFYIKAAEGLFFGHFFSKKIRHSNGNIFDLHIYQYIIIIKKILFCNFPKNINRLVNTGFFKKLLKDLPRHFSEVVGKLKTVAEQDDMKDIRLYAHTVKGMAANISAGRLSQAASEIELSAKQGGTDPIPQLMEKLDQEIKRLLKVLESEKGV